MTSLRKLFSKYNCTLRVKSRCPKFPNSTIDFVFYEFMSWINECSTFSKGWFEFWHGYVCENKCESDRDSLLIVVKVFSLRSARSFTSTCQLLHTHQPVAKSSLVQGNGVKYFLTENSNSHMYNTMYSQNIYFFSSLIVAASKWMFYSDLVKTEVYENKNNFNPLCHS